MKLKFAKTTWHKIRRIYVNRKYKDQLYGTKEEPDKSGLVLSDSFLGGKEEHPFLECRAVVLNINKGHNQELITESCITRH